MSYTDHAISSVWKFVGYMHVASIIIIAVQFYVLDVELRKSFGAMMEWMILVMPLSILYVSMGVGITGNILKEKYFDILAMLGTGIAIASFLSLSFLTDSINGIYAIAAIILLIVPGHILNKKRREV